MKRSALTAAVEEIVERGKLKTEEGALFYPVMAEPAVMAFFGAPEALTEVITQRPLLLLNLIMTNKALQKFWEQTPDIWLILIDNLILNESNPLFLDTYPFFAIANRRARVVLDFERPAVKQRALEKTYGDGDFMKKSLFYQAFNEPGKLLGHEKGEPEEVAYQLVYYDVMTQRFIDILQLVVYLHGYTLGDANEGLYYYIERHFRLGTLNCLDDCFLIQKTMELEYRAINYDLIRMNVVIEEIKQRSALYEFSETGLKIGSSSVTPYPKTFLDMFARLKLLLNSLSFTLVNHINGTNVIVQKEPVYIDLDKAIATPYRSMLYDKEQGIYNTPDKQRTLLLGLLARTKKHYLGNDMIEKYGQMTPLSCFLCRKETYMVVPLLKKAFCTPLCYSLFTK